MSGMSLLDVVKHIKESAHETPLTTEPSVTPTGHTPLFPDSTTEEDMEVDPFLYKNLKDNQEYWDFLATVEDEDEDVPMERLQNVFNTIFSTTEDNSQQPPSSALVPRSSLPLSPNTAEETVDKADNRTSPQPDSLFTDPAPSLPTATPRIDHATQQRLHAGYLDLPDSPYTTPTATTAHTHTKAGTHTHAARATTADGARAADGSSADPDLFQSVLQFCRHREPSEHTAKHHARHKTIGKANIPEASGNSEDALVSSLGTDVLENEPGVITIDPTLIAKLKGETLDDAANSHAENPPVKIVDDNSNDSALTLTRSTSPYVLHTFDAAISPDRLQSSVALQLLCSVGQSLAKAYTATVEEETPAKTETLDSGRKTAETPRNNGTKTESLSRETPAPDETLSSNTPRSNTLPTQQPPSSARTLQPTSTLSPPTLPLPPLPPLPPHAPSQLSTSLSSTLSSTLPSRPTPAMQTELDQHHMQTPATRRTDPYHPFSDPYQAFVPPVGPAHVAAQERLAYDIDQAAYDYEQEQAAYNSQQPTRHPASSTQIIDDYTDVLLDPHIPPSGNNFSFFPTRRIPDADIMAYTRDRAGFTAPNTRAVTHTNSGAVVGLPRTRVTEASPSHTSTSSLLSSTASLPPPSESLATVHYLCQHIMDKLSRQQQQQQEQLQKYDQTQQDMQATPEPEFRRFNEIPKTDSFLSSMPADSLAQTHPESDIESISRTQYFPNPILSPAPAAYAPPAYNEYRGPAYSAYVPISTHRAALQSPLQSHAIYQSTPALSSPLLASRMYNHRAPYMTPGIPSAYSPYIDKSYTAPYPATATPYTAYAPYPASAQYYPASNQSYPASTQYYPASAGPYAATSPYTTSYGAPAQQQPHYASAFPSTTNPVVDNLDNFDAAYSSTAAAYTQPTDVSPSLPHSAETDDITTDNTTHTSLAAADANALAGAVSPADAVALAMASLALLQQSIDTSVGGKMDQENWRNSGVGISEDLNGGYVDRYVRTRATEANLPLAHPTAPADPRSLSPDSETRGRGYVPRALPLDIQRARPFSPMRARATTYTAPLPHLPLPSVQSPYSALPLSSVQSLSSARPLSSVRPSPYSHLDAAVDRGNPYPTRRDPANTTPLPLRERDPVPEATSYSSYATRTPVTRLPNRFASPAVISAHGDTYAHRRYDETNFPTTMDRPTFSSNVGYDRFDNRQTARDSSLYPTENRRGNVYRAPGSPFLTSLPHTFSPSRPSSGLYL